MLGFIVIVWFAFGGLAAWRELNRDETASRFDFLIALLMLFAGPVGLFVQRLFYGRA